LREGHPRRGKKEKKSVHGGAQENATDGKHRCDRRTTILSNASGEKRTFGKGKKKRRKTPVLLNLRVEA